MTYKPAERDIERWIDAVGMESFLATVATICSNKAEHVAVHWQDTRLAKEWMALSRHLDLLSLKAKGL